MFLERARLFSTVILTFHISTSSVRGLGSSTSSPILVIFNLFNFSHCAGLCNDIVLWLPFAFPWWLTMLRIFSCAYWPFIFFFDYFLIKNTFASKVKFYCQQLIITCQTSVHPNCGFNFHLGLQTPRSSCLTRPLSERHSLLETVLFLKAVLKINGFPWCLSQGSLQVTENHSV